MIGKTRRSFSRRYRIPWVGLCITGTLLALASCAPRSEHWSSAETTKRLQVDRAEFKHLVRFQGSAAVPGREELKRLNGFLARQTRDYGVRAWIGGGDTLLDVRRQAAIMSLLRKHGLNPKLDSGPAARRSQPGTVQVTLVRYVVTLPNCGDWSKDPALDRSNQPSSNFGCATAANLGMMVADPGVLVRGRDLDPGDGQVLAKGVENYRKGKVKISKKTNEFFKSDGNKTQTGGGN